MAPSRRKGASKAAAAASAAAAAGGRQWKVGDLVLAKLKGFPAWPATVSEPEKWGFSADWRKVLVYFFGTQQIAFCNPLDVEAFTEEKKQILLVKCQGKGADFVRAVQEIIDIYEKSKKQEQFDSDAEVTAANFGNALESSANLHLKEILEAPAEISDMQARPSIIKEKSNCNEINLTGKEARVPMQVEGLLVKPEAKDMVPEGRAKDQPVLCTYSLRKKSGGSQTNGSIPRTRVPPVRRSRSLPRAEAPGLENITLSCKDSEKSFVSISSNSVQDASSWKSGWTRKTLDISKGDDKDTTTFVQDGSIENSGSEISSMESESTSFDDGSAAYSSLKQEQVTVVDCVEGKVELRKGLDLQINAALKKKRKPNKKRVINDAAEPICNADNGAITNIVNSAGQDSESTFARTVESCPKDDGDGHLPLLKRARVRMGKLLPKEDENTSITCSEEKVLKVVPESSLDLNHNSFFKERVLKVVEVDTSMHDKNGLSNLEEENSAKGNLHASLNSLSLSTDPVSPCIKRETSDGVSISEDCTEYSDQRTSLLKLVKSQSCVSSVDGEAALPPSKHLHRALEAMYENATQECPSSYGAPSVAQPTASSCICSQSSFHVAMACESVNDLRLLVQDSIANHVSHVTLPPAHLSQESLRKTVIGVEMDVCPQSIERPESSMQVEKKTSVSDEGVKHVCTPISEDPVTDSVMETQTQSTRTLSPLNEASEPLSRLNQAFPDPSYTKDEADAAIPKFGDSSSRDESAADRSPCFVPEGEKITVVYSGFGTEALQEYNCVNGGNEQRRLKCEESSQDHMMCLATETRHHLVLGNSNHVSFSNPEVEDSDFPSSPNVGIHSSPRVSQLSATMTRTCNSDEDRSKSSKRDNGSCSPVEASRCSNSGHDAADSNRILNSSVTSLTSVSKDRNYSEAHAALSSFEVVLGTLTRTKESISRATRIALNCAKLGFASKAFEILARNLENETSLYRRVDMFFLVDSIMQWSRGLKGDTGGGFPPLIQGALARLLSSAAPPGSSAHENRRQCLKVLKLWQERRFFPDSILRHHMRDLDVLFSGISSANPYSRRSSRNERAFDDPVREMEGMLVDEYGSNSSFQLPGFCMPRMLKNGDEGSDSDSDGSFEAVTPEHNTPESPQQGKTSTMGKHCHILQDVDGELEMEDITPEVEMISTEKSQKFEQRFSPSVHGAPPPVLPPSPQSISPLPPTPPSLPPLPPLPTSTMSDCHVDGLHQNCHANAQNTQVNLGQPPPHLSSVTPRTERRMLGGSHYHCTEDRAPQQQMPMPVSSNSAYSRRSMENGDHEDGPRFNNGNRGYNMRPPYSPPSNRFSHGRSDHCGRPRRAGPPPYSGRFHHQHSRGNGNYHYSNHNRMKPPPYEVQENCRFSAPYSGPRYPEKGRSSWAPGPYGGTPCEPERFPNHGWSSYPPRLIGHRSHMPYRPHYEGPNYWRPR